MLGNIRISFKLLAMVVLSLVGMIGVALVGLNALKTNLLEDRKARLRDVVVLAVQDVSREYQDGIAVGLSKQAANARAAAALRSFRYGNDDYFLAYDKSGLSTAHPDAKIEGQSRWDVKDPDGVYYVRAMIDGAARGGAFIGYRFPHIGSTEPVQKLTYALEVKENGWIVGSGIYIDDVDIIFRAYVWRIGSIVGVMLLVVLGASVLLGQSITRPARALTRAMRALAGGKLETTVPHVDQRDEVGEMARAAVVFKDNAIAVQRLQQEQAEARERVAAEKHLALSTMADTIERDTGASLEQIQQRTEALTETANDMSASASRTGVAAETAASAAAQALSNAQTVAAAAEQLTASIREIGMQVSQSHAVVSRAVTAGNETRTTIEALNQEVERIGAVADMIGEIASKTNLLALNATIEAARAGDAGKGFAVVASEVKQLAAQTARSTHEIAEHINQVRSATEASVAAVARIEHTITEVSAISGSIAAAVEQQGAATAEIARTVTETASAADEMTARTGEVSNEAHDTGRYAADVRENASALAEAIVDLRHAVIRVVRSSTAEVDRRMEQRVHIERACQLTVGRQTYKTHLIDVSTGGAQLAGTFPLQVGDRGQLALDGIAAALPCTVKVVDRHALHLQFALDPQAAGALREVIDKLRPLQAA